jgi:hypothetical protein
MVFGAPGMGFFAAAVEEDAHPESMRSSNAASIQLNLSGFRFTAAIEHCKPPA